MKKLFPAMYDCPEWQQVMIGGFYWVVYMFLLPALLNLVWMAIAPTDCVYAWICVLYYILNTLAVAWIFLDYLKESFWIFRDSVGTCLRTVLCGLLVFAAVQIPAVCFSGSWAGYIREVAVFPVADTLFQVSPKASLDFYPWLSAPFFVTLVPFAMGGLYFAMGFAPMCVRRGWKGYLVVAALAWVSCLFFHLYDRSVEDLWLTFLNSLPFYMCACWVYQKTDTVWAPMIFHGTVNLLGVILYLNV